MVFKEIPVQGLKPSIKRFTSPTQQQLTVAHNEPRPNLSNAYPHSTFKSRNVGNVVVLGLFLKYEIPGG